MAGTFRGSCQGLNPQPPAKFHNLHAMTALQFVVNL